MKNTNNKFWLSRSVEAKTPRVSSSFSSPSFDTTSISKLSKLSARSQSIGTTLSRRGAGPIDVDEVDDTWNSDDDERLSPGWVSPVSYETENKADPRQYNDKKLFTGPVDLDEDLSLSMDESFLLQNRTTSILQIEHHDVEDHIIGWKSSVDSPEPRGVSENISIEAIHNSGANYGGEHQTMVVQTLSSIRRNIAQPKKVIPKLQRSKRDTPNVKTSHSAKRHNNPNQDQSIPPIQLIDTATTTDEESLHLVMPPVMQRIEDGSNIRELSRHSRDKKSTSSFVSDDDVANNEDDDDDVSQVWELRSGSVEWQSILHKTGLADRLGSNYEGDFSSTSRSTNLVPQNNQAPESSAVSKPNFPPGKNTVDERVDLKNRNHPNVNEGDENNTDEPVGRLGIQEMPSRPEGLPKPKQNANSSSPVVPATSQAVSPGLRTYPNAAYISDSEDERGSFDELQAPSTPNQNNTGVASSFFKRLSACVSPITPAESDKNNKTKNLSKESPRSTMMKFSLPALCGRPDNVYDETSEFTNTEASVQVVTSASELEYKRLKDSFVGKTRASPTPPRERTLYRSNSNNKYDVQITPSRTVSTTSSRDGTPSRDGQPRSSNSSNARKFVPVGVVPVPKTDSMEKLALKFATSGSSPMTRTNSTSTTNSSSGSLGNSPPRVPSDHRKNKTGNNNEEIIIAENFSSEHFFQ